MNLAQRVAEALAGDKHGVHQQFGAYVIRCPLHGGSIETLRIRNSRWGKYGVVIECDRGCDTTPLYEQIPSLVQDLDNSASPEAVQEVPSTAKLQQKQSEISGFATPLSKIERREVLWFWEPYVPQGKITLLEGDPGVGKTWLALWLCAEATRGGRVAFYASGDDDPSDTLRVRAEALGADLDRLFVTEHFTIGEGYQLQNAVESLRPKLIVIDPLQSFIGGGTDVYRMNEVREKLKKLMQLSASFNVAVIVIRHLRKTSSDRALYRGSGSIDFAAAARSVLLVGQVGDERAMVHTKSSLGPPGPSLAFWVEGNRFGWLGPREIRAEDLLAPDPAPHGALSEGVRFLREILTAGPLPPSDIEKMAAAQGISPRTLRRAKKILGIQSISDREGGRIGRWLWARSPDGQD